MTTLIERLKARTKFEPATGCWIWTQAMCGSGTPSIHIGELNGQKSLNARRLMFLLACGQLDSFWLVHANCGDSRCINPEHLKAVRRVDLNRKVAKSRRYHGPAKKLAPQAWHP